MLRNVTQGFKVEDIKATGYEGKSKTIPVTGREGP
jgi:hypothetical protein